MHIEVQKTQNLFFFFFFKSLHLYFSICLQHIYIHITYIYVNSDLLWCRLAPSHPSQITDLSLLFYFLKIQEYISIFFWSDKSCLLVFINDQILRIKTYTVQMYTVQMIEIDKAVLYSYYHKHNMMYNKQLMKRLFCILFYFAWLLPPCWYMSESFRAIRQQNN